MRIADYTIVTVNDLHVVLIDNDANGRPSVTNSAEAVIRDLDARLGGLGTRRVFYRDTVQHYDELKHDNGQFKGYGPCTAAQQAFLSAL